MDPNNGPGSTPYILHSSNNGITIGVKRQEHIEKTPGPGDYSHEKADSLTKSKSVSQYFGRNPSNKALTYRLRD